ncbi:DUF6266 family protein [Sphingobacterium multivorum]|uniref:Uncharacterized protein n=1 Tax=Sphingobacterium multivorum TaxID=28454 RepID=A0A2X2JJF8_SPHMU|nr:DUF6266 family protein [Sphingobacterium multivorum]QRQ60235.1 hypothetical protein I6J33_19140 [Sphingobacterium multivorum]SPZ91853.1 Uncharacterised protein [Sphingobacterium multivorum]
MANVTQGINGPPSGKVGAVVFCKWKEINYVRSLPRVNKKRALSEKEVNNRNKFGLMQQFLSPYTKVIRLGFSTSAKNMTAFNAAMSYNLHHAMQQDDEGFHIDYEKIAISRGLDEEITGATFQLLNETIHITWELKNTEKLLYEDLTDFRTLVLLIPENPINASQGVLLQNYIMDLRVSIQIPKLTQSDTYHLYLGFVAADGTNRSMNSSYLGNINLERGLSSFRELNSSTGEIK